MAELPAKLAAEPDRGFVHMCVSAAPIGWYDYQFDASSLWEGVYTNMPSIDYAWGIIFRDIEIGKDLAKVSRSVWLVLGRYGYQTGTPFLQAKAQYPFKNLTISVFEKSAHTPQLEEAEVFNQTLPEWLE